jgi:hypothetical protein
MGKIYRPPMMNMGKWRIIIGSGKPRCLQKTFLPAPMCPINPLWITSGLNLGLNGEKLASLLRYASAYNEP